MKEILLSSLFLETEEDSKPDLYSDLMQDRAGQIGLSFYIYRRLLSEILELFQDCCANSRGGFPDLKAKHARLKRDRLLVRLERWNGACWQNELGWRLCRFT